MSKLLYVLFASSFIIFHSKASEVPVLLLFPNNTYCQGLAVNQTESYTSASNQTPVENQSETNSVPLNNNNQQYDSLEDVDHCCPS